MYTLDKSFFNKIDTQEKAYFLGLLYADGYNDEKRNCVEICLQQKDLHILEELNKLIKSNKPLSINKVSELYKSQQNSIKLRMSGKEISENLARLGCYQKKSLTLKFPTKKQVPENLIRHFIRGFYDGDGCLYLRMKYNYLEARISIVSNYDFCKSLAKIIMKQIGYNCSLKKEKNEITTKLYIYKKSDIKSFLKWIYQDSVIHLNRKYDKYVKLLDNNFPRVA